MYARSMAQSYQDAWREYRRLKIILLFIFLLAPRIIGPIADWLLSLLLGF